jgi:DNA-binding response OmpR family regulator
MADHREIALHLPRLRRYARMLTASRLAGDALVTALLEAIVADPCAAEQCLDGGGSAPRVALHCAFATSCEMVAAALDGPLPPPGRRASLLVAVEGFSFAEAASILGVDEPCLAALIDEDDRARSAEPGGAMLVLDAETLLTFDVAEILQSAGHRIVGTPRTHAEAVALAHAMRPDVVVATGTVTTLDDGAPQLETAGAVGNICGAATLVLSAYPEGLLKGSESGPTFLVDKPFRPDALVVAVAQALMARRRDRKIAASRNAGGVLILDTDREATHGLSRMLTDFGYRVVGAPSTRTEAIALAHAARPDIVIATGTRDPLKDHYFPVQTAEEVQQVCGAWPVVLTGMPADYRREIAREPPFVVVKPYAMEIVRALVERLLRMRRDAGFGAGRDGAVSPPRASSRPGA